MTTKAEVQDKMTALEVVAENLRPKDKEFAKSLLEYFAKKHMVSDKQLYWVQILTERAMKSEEEPPKPEETKVGNFAGVYKLFQTAKKHLKYPKLFLTVFGVDVVVSMSGETSKMPNTINVAGVGDFATRPWYGRVLEDGTWQKSPKGANHQEEVEKLLKAMSRNPASAAKAHGSLHGRCCFCNLPLSDEKSTAAGFGRTCAKNWNLLDEWKQAAGVLKEEAKKEVV